ncbi:hypothetical protein GCM10023143_01790 [Compostibacter hankyongensis]|uniref:HEPN domain-containing protein n=2 Tax=Compostibacter hankyongensis TaxID=1007089 RepID=A0ABP8FCS3_9BACT
MLHQSAEQALITLIKSATEYHPNTHNIERLLRYAGLVSYRIPDVFSQGNEQDRRLLSLLQKAYIDSRYNKNYKICNDDLLHLMGKIRHLHDILLKTGENIFNT